ncbi:PfkB family carbohydrate kinase [Alteribacillus bidgolensis]|uniref:PfkB family carbohydrate kinase n=1 Tax=Alteribacillus bidgolensis TaxID=930129 RepID=UPI003182CD50
MKVWFYSSRVRRPLRYVDSYRKTVGGAETNVAIALTRLGHQTGWISKLGEDEFGLYVQNVIRGEGVDTSRVVFDDQAPTAVFFKERMTNQDPNIYYYRHQQQRVCYLLMIWTKTIFNRPNTFI